MVQETIKILSHYYLLLADRIKGKWNKGKIESKLLSVEMRAECMCEREKDSICNEKVWTVER